MTPAAEQDAQPITRLDRCDRCGAGATTRASVAGTDLHFCGHHWAEHSDAVMDVADSVFADAVVDG